MAEEQEKIVVSAFWVSLGTSLSRLVGLAREIVMAAAFGTGMVADAFSVAFRFPNLLRRVLGEGGLTRVFIPKYTEIVQKHSPEDADAFASTLMVVIIGFSLFVIFIMFGFAPLIVRILAFGWSGEPAKLALTSSLLRILSFFILFMSLFALFMGYLNAHRRFFIPALSPAFFNLIWFAGAALAYFFLPPDDTLRIFVVSGFVLLGGIVQFVSELPSSIKLGFRMRIDFRRFRPDILEVGILLIPAAFSLIVSELNYFVDTFIASLLPEGSVAALQYGSRLILLPLGLIGTAIATASLPSFSASSARRDMVELSRLTSYSVRIIFAFLIPIALITVALRYPIVVLVLQRGNFTAGRSTPMTALALMCYSFGLFAFGSVNVLSQAFYSMKDTKTPVYMGIIALVVNATLNIILMGPLKHGGIALATSISNILYFVLLAVIFAKKIGGEFATGGLGLSFLRFSLIGVVGASAAYGALYFIKILIVTSYPFVDRTIYFAVPAIVGILVIWVLYELLGIKEHRMVIEPLIMRIKARIGR